MFAVSAVALPQLMTLLYFSAIFTASAYMGPVLLALNPLSPAAWSWTLLVFGMMTPQQSRLASQSAKHPPMLLSLNALMWLAWLTLLQQFQPVPPPPVRQTP